MAHSGTGPADDGAVVVRARPRAISRVLGHDWRLAYVLMAPVMAVLAGLIAYPFGMAIVLSLQSKYVGGQAQFVGLQNFRTLFADPAFRTTVVNSAVYTVTAVSCKLVFGLVSAQILHSVGRARNLFRALLLLPWAAPVVVGAYAWKWILNDMNGVLNSLLFRGGIITWPIGWLSNPRIALWSVIAVVVWQGTPFYTLNFLAGLSSIDQTLYEAAAIDGAGPVQRYLHVTLPGLWPIIMVTVLLSTIWTSASMDSVFVLTLGGPLNATKTFPILSYLVGIQLGELGKGAAIALTFAPFLVPIIAILASRLLRQE
jgi:ABC-type sugar transport system permease subunit